MKIFIILLNKFIYFIGKLINKGSSMPGKISLKLDKNILKKVKLPKNIVMVTGSNGKTSTTEIINSILSKNGFKVGCNVKGSNQIEGVTTVVLNSCNLIGKVKKDILVLEVDEQYLKYVTKYITPNYLVVTNLYRDQMTRNGHPEYIYETIKQGVPQETTLILNTDDPLSSMLGYKRENVIYFGIGKTDMDSTKNNSAYNDGEYCPNCKSKMEYEYYHFNHIGKYECKNCGHARKEPQYEITDIDLKTGLVKINSKYELQLSLTSMYNAYNELAAFAVSNTVGISEEKIIEELNKYILKNDRVQVFDIEGKKGMLLTSKHENSISYNQSLRYIVKENKPCSVVIIIDAVSRKYFTSETSWIWDIDFELLDADCIKEIILAGKYVNDLSIRFKYTNIDQSKIVREADLDEMMKKVKESKNENIYVVTCFSDRMKFMDRR